MYLRERAEGYKSKHQCDQRYTEANVCDDAQCKFVSALKRKIMILKYLTTNKLQISRQTIVLFSFNTKVKKNGTTRSRLDYVRFPALYSGYVLLFQVLIGSF